jgi:hypothetical protein
VGREGARQANTKEVAEMRAMAFVWSVILVGGITYFSIIGLIHH